MAIERLRQWVLKVARVPPPPSAPEGTSGPVHLFRAAPAYYRYRQWRWGLAELGGGAGLVLGYLFLPLVAKFLRFPHASTLLTVIEAAAWVGFLLLIPFSYALIRLDYELRWYLMTDHSLRIREGVLSTREQTMTFANVQHVSIRQDPLQRLLGIADLEVWTAGGGEAKADADTHSHGGGLHVGYLRGVDNAEELRTLILEHLRRSRDAGLGDPDDAIAPQLPGGVTTPELPRLQEAATALLDEVRLLRREASHPESYLRTQGRSTS